MNTALNQIEIESRIANLRVNYEPHETAFLQLKERIEMAIYHQYKAACVITGDTGTGKSTLSERASANFPRVETEEGSRVPLLYFKLMSKPTFIGVLKGILAEYGVPTKSRQTQLELFALLKTQVAACGTRVLILDDAQHFVEDRSREAIHASADDMKVLIDLGLLVVLSGTPNLLSIFSINSQLRRRFATRVHLRPLDCKNKASVMTLRDTVLDLFEKSESGLFTEEFDPTWWLKCHFATNGNISYINKLVAATAAEALRNGRTKIKESDFSAAFQSQIYFDATPLTNPFHKKFDVRPLNKPGEPFEDMEVLA